MNYLLINIREYRRDNQKRGQSIEIGNKTSTRLAIHTNLFKNLRTFRYKYMRKKTYLSRIITIFYIKFKIIGHSSLYSNAAHIIICEGCHFTDMYQLN